MVYIVLIFGALTFLTGIAIIIKPGPVFRFLGRYSASISAHVSAIVIRLMLGVALISCSEISKFPITFQVIGWMSLAAATILILMGRQRFKVLIAWATTIAPFYHHLGGLVAMLFGGFLVYAVV